MHRLHDEPISDVKAIEGGIFTVCNKFNVKFWERPQQENESPFDEEIEITPTKPKEIEISSPKSTDLDEEESDVEEYGTNMDETNMDETKL